MSRRRWKIENEGFNEKKWNIYNSKAIDNLFFETIIDELFKISIHKFFLPQPNLYKKNFIVFFNHFYYKILSFKLIFLIITSNSTKVNPDFFHNLRPILFTNNTIFYTSCF